MVEACAVEYNRYNSYLTNARELVIPNSHTAYPYRSLNLDESYLGKYINSLNVGVGQLPDGPVRNKLASHYVMIQDACKALECTDKPARYVDIFPGVNVDAFSVLENIGAMRASKMYQGIYSLARNLPALLAFICDEVEEEIRKRIEESCAKENTSMENLSRALCGVEQGLLSTVKLDCLVGVSENLDSFMSNIMANPTTCCVNAGNGQIDLRSPKYTLEDRVSTLITFHLACLQQYIFNALISDYCICGTNKILLTSKGVSTLTYQADNPEDLKSILIKLGDNKPFTLYASKIRKGSLWSTLRDGFI